MKRKLFFVSLCLTAYLFSFEQIRLPRLVRDSMVLQRDVQIPIWGWAGKGERISVEFGGKSYRGRAGDDGKWMLELSPMKAGGPYTMVISGKNRIVLHDVLVGDVWLCSGQSNMVHQLKLHSVRYPDAISGAHYPEIRQFWVPTLTNLQGPQDDLPAGHWASAIPEDVPEFSAVAYFFARDLYEKYHVPIGIINASVGGTPIEAWISSEGLKDFPEVEETIRRNKDTAYINGIARERAAEMAGMPKLVDKGLTGPEPWYSVRYLPKGWRQIGVPGYWEDQGVRNLDGVVWYRREIEVPQTMVGKAAKVFLGRIVNADALYINGVEVGNTTYEYPQRRYTVPEGLLKPGKNLFVVRVTNTFGKGGFVPDKPYCLIAGEDTVDLKGYWEYKVGGVFVPRGGHGGVFSAQNAPTALYNAMIAPLVPFGIKGFLWYQGEANSNNAAEYAKLQPAMIADWRRLFKEGELPFLYVQLPGFGDYNYLPAESGWAELRAAQLASLAVRKTGMAVAIDLGEWNDIHPDRKEPVGDRLALAAEKIAYGDSVVYSGPVCSAAMVVGGKVALSFTHLGGGLITNDGEEPQEFAVAGVDKKFVWAGAKIEGDKVVVWNDSVKDVRYVRYAWADDPVDPNLCNREGLPASPFEMVVSGATAQVDSKGLKDYYAGYFPIGVAVGPKDLGGDEARLILEQFNSLTPENAMKMGPIHPQENVYHWEDADSIVSFAQRHGLRVRGHNLCWHNQAPAWLFKDANGNTVGKEQLLQRLKDHITTVVSRYKGKLYAWDVVNEAIADDSGHYMRPSLWYQICGEEFIEKAFEYAHAADPGAVLFYNDYNTENPVKREKIYKLLKGLLAKGVPVGGIGLQAHWSVNTPTREELEKSIQLFSSLGLQVQITELDISVYAGHQGGQLVSGEGRSAVDSGFTADMEQKQLEKYKMVFEVFRKYKDKITGVTFWNVSDRHSWLDNRGRKNYPLLFDKELRPKKAWHAVTEWAGAGAGAGMDAHAHADLGADVRSDSRTGHDLWLPMGVAEPVTVVCNRNTPTLEIAREELRNGWQGSAGVSVNLVVKKDKALRGDGFRIGGRGRGIEARTVESNTEIGVLYGVYELLRRQRTGDSLAAGVSNPSYGLRLLDHWDNLNGSVERGYAGSSIFWRENDLVVTDADKKRWREYARANASIGINGAVLNNVNASPKILTPEYVARAKAIAEVLRPYGIKAYLAVNFASPVSLGGLKTADPLDPAVIAWWVAKVKEVYASIPDLGGFLVKASSEGQPGPQQYGRTHADGANMLADALKPYNGVMIWRAFVYAANDNDRAKQAYTEFMPLDGRFRDNVIIQVKNGPVDFQPREPFSPLFGAMKKTPVAPEFQITQEYLGHSVYVVFLSTMWEECLRSDTYQQGPGSTVSRVTDGSVYPQKYTLMAGVANIGTDDSWCGNLFAQANWYAFGRLAWNDTLSSERIADEWLRQTFSLKEALGPVKQMLLDSREAAVNFMMPLGLHHIMSANGHYGPGPWWAPAKTRADWTPRYYHQASASGIGFDRTKTGSDAVDQYHEPLAAEFDDVRTCPEKYLLWFHRVPWDYQTKDGQRLWDALCHRWDTGVRQVRSFQTIWDKAKPFVDSVRFAAVQHKLREECANAILWKDACMLYFQQFSGMPIPDDVDRPVHSLDDIIAHEFDVRIP